MLPTDLTGQQTILAKGRKPPTSTPDSMYGYPPNPFAGWNPYMSAGPFNIPPGPSYPFSGPSGAPFYPPYPTTPHTNISPNPPTNEGRCRSPSDDSQTVEYPAISDFLAELTATDRGNHYFDNYTDHLNQHGYYHLDQLADETLTAERMIEMIPGMKDGTARAIKNKALAKIKKIKGKDKAK